MKTLPIAARLGSVALLAILAGLPLSATAAHDINRVNPGFYLGGGVGYDKLDSEDFTNNGGGRGVEDTRVTFKGVAGLRLGQALSLEGQYIDFGTAEDGGNRVEATGFTAGVVLHIPAFRYVHPYGKAGVLFWDANGSFNNLSSKEEGNDFTYGGGVRFAVNDRVDIRAEYERFEFDKTDVDHLSAIIQYNF